MLGKNVVQQTMQYVMQTYIHFNSFSLLALLDVLILKYCHGVIVCLY